MEEVTADGCASKVVAQLRAGWGHQRIERLVMLGLGPVSASAPARYQLALGLVLARELLGSGALLQATEHSTKSTVGNCQHSLRMPRSDIDDKQASSRWCTTPYSTQKTSRCWMHSSVVSSAKTRLRRFEAHDSLWRSHAC